MDNISNWGGYPSTPANVYQPTHATDYPDLTATTTSWIARGNGRCYGDSALQHQIFSSLRLNKIIELDEEQAQMTCEAGVLLADVLDIITPKGFFVPVVPGTQLVTIGGMVAANIHGKNHLSAGTFGDYVLGLELMNEAGEVVQCSPTQNEALFRQTIGGMGLSGIISAVSFRLIRRSSSYLYQRSFRANTLAELVTLFEQHEQAPFSVAWIDSLAKGQALGRGVLKTARFANFDELPNTIRPQAQTSSTNFSIPKNTPAFLLNQLVLWINNWRYFQQGKESKEQLLSYRQFFFPLDGIGHWNRLYGRKGLLQYQFVIPLENALEHLNNILQEIAQSGVVSYLSVLKKMGAASKMASPLSFPMLGYSLAMDFKYSSRVLALLDKLDELVVAYGGRVYLVKDARLSAKNFRAMYPDFVPPSKRFASLQSLRLTSKTTI